MTVARGASDGRTVVLVPEAKGQQVTGMTLLHVRFHDACPGRAKAVLAATGPATPALADAVTETEPLFDDSGSAVSRSSSCSPSRCTNWPGDGGAPA